MQNTPNTYTQKNNCIRAARKALGADAQPGVAFTLTQVEGGWAWAAAANEQGGPQATLPVERVPVVSPDGGAAWAALYEANALKPEPIEDEEPAPKAMRGKSGALVEAAARPEGITNTRIKEMTGWTKLGGFFGAVKRAGCTLERKRENGDTTWFAKRAGTAVA